MSQYGSTGLTCTQERPWQEPWLISTMTWAHWTSWSIRLLFESELPNHAKSLNSAHIPNLLTLCHLRSAFQDLDFGIPGSKSLFSMDGYHSFVPLQAFTQCRLLKTREREASIISIVSLTKLRRPVSAEDSRRVDVAHLCHSLAARWERHKIRVNWVQMHYTTRGARTRMFQNLDSEENNGPVERIGQVSDLDAAVVWLASPVSKWVTGSRFIVNYQDMYFDQWKILESTFWIWYMMYTYDEEGQKFADNDDFLPLSLSSNRKPINPRACIPLSLFSLPLCGIRTTFFSPKAKRWSSVELGTDVEFADISTLYLPTGQRGRGIALAEYSLWQWLGTDGQTEFIS